MRNKYRAWDTFCKRFRDEFDWIVSPDDGLIYKTHAGEDLCIQNEFTQLIPQQCIGKIDCNGKEIYEGDICNVFNGDMLIHTCIIEFRGIGFWFVDEDNDCWVFSPESFKIEIIGHIYE